MCMCALICTVSRQYYVTQTAQMTLWCWQRSISLCQGSLPLSILIDSLPVETSCYNVENKMWRTGIQRMRRVSFPHLSRQSALFYFACVPAWYQTLTHAQHAVCHWAGSSAHFLLCILRQFSLNGLSRPWPYSVGQEGLEFTVLIH